ncbi:MAG: hypothetical protein ABI472_00860 [Ginsengibacter sp.]
MRYTLLFSILLLLFMSCNKDKFSSTPSLKFTSVNTTQLHNQQLIQFTLSFTDSEGDILNNDSALYIQQVVPDCLASNTDSYYPLPDFPTTKNQKGDIIVTFSYNSVVGYTSLLTPQCQKNDTAVFRFALRDQAKHVSDTVSSPPIILYYP